MNQLRLYVLWDLTLLAIPVGRYWYVGNRLSVGLSLAHTLVVLTLILGLVGLRR